MLMKTVILFLGLLTAVQLQSQTTVLHNLLQKHVDEKGMVDYLSLKKDLPKLKKYTAYLAKTTPNNTWSTNKQKAFYINAYNAYTLLLILHEFPLKSIKEISIDGKNAWEIPFAKVGNTSYTLNFIEHQILRKKFTDSRIHVGVNCASISCPKLSNIAFTEKNIETELERLMSEFVNDSSKNSISNNKIEISAIFDWFQSDFIKEKSLFQYLNSYSKIAVDTDAKIKYLPYNWALNQQ